MSNDANDSDIRHERFGREFKRVKFGSIAMMVVLFVLADPMWPIAPLLLVSAWALLFVRLRPGVWARAAEAVLLPACIGFGILAVALGTLNYALPDGASRANVTRAEVTIIRAAEILPRWTITSWWMLVAALVILIPIARLLPRLELVKRFLALRRAGATATAALAVATTCSFFTSDGMLGAKAEGARTRVVAVLREDREKETKSIAEFVATRAVEKTLIDSVATGKHVTAVVMEISEHPKLSEDAKIALADEVGREWAEARHPPAEQSPPADGAPERSMPRITSDNAAVLVADQKAMTARATTAAKSEVPLAAHAILAATAGLLPQGMDKLMEHVLQTFVSGNEAAFLEPVQQYLSKVADKSLEVVTEHLVAAVTERAARAVHAGVGTEITTTPARELVQREIYELGVIRPATESAEAMAALADAERLQSSDANAAKEGADHATDLAAHAGQLRTFFGEAADGAPAASRDAAMIRQAGQPRVMRQVPADLDSRIAEIKGQADRVHAAAVDHIEEVAREQAREHEGQRRVP